jgi:histidine triad (HIT) family protein
LDNPLSDEQIEELNKIIKLPREEQAIKLQSFLKTLNKEQIEFLKQHQTQQCLFCGIVFGNIPSYKVYEDNEFLAILDINPANLGHVLIMPKAHLKNTYEVNQRIFEIANLVSKKIKEKLDADSNIFIANGENAGQKTEHIIIHVIPRYKDDNINLIWQPKKVNQDKLNEILPILKIEEERKEVKKEKTIIKINKKKERIP